MVCLSELLTACQISYALKEKVWISSIEQHSQSVRPGTLFFAFDGLHTSGTKWAKEAEERGAVAVVSEQAIADLTIPVIYVEGIRRLFGSICAAFWGNPERDLTLIGVTGTDGKSSTASFIQQLFTQIHTRCGLLSTITVDDGKTRITNPYGQSTVEANHLFAFLAACRDNGLTHVVLEASSHGLSSEFDRLGPIRFSTAVITTITSEHLDFHRTAEHYRETKLRILDRLSATGTFVSSTENPALAASLARLKDEQHAVVVGRDLLYEIRKSSWAGTTLAVADKEVQSAVILPAMLNNALLAYAAVAASISGEISIDLLEFLHPIPGRMEVVPNKLGAIICIDFAHTPDSYRKVFTFAKQHTKGKIITVAGATGRRDRSKRAEMGSIARANSDLLIYTEEDPRDEDLDQIFSDLRANERREAGILPIEIPNRQRAIAYALSRLASGDTLLLLGKGHEEEMIGATGSQQYNEREAVEAALKEKELI